MTQGALAGSLRKWIFEDLYEQCSFHIAEKMPSSLIVGVRPMSWRMRPYSCALSPWAATTAGVTLTGWGVLLFADLCSAAAPVSCLSFVLLRVGLRPVRGRRAETRSAAFLGGLELNGYAALAKWS